MDRAQAAFNAFLLALAQSRGWDPEKEDGLGKLVEFLGFPGKKIRRWIEGGTVEGACRGSISQKTGFNFQTDDIRQAQEALPGFIKDTPHPDIGKCVDADTFEQLVNQMKAAIGGSKAGGVLVERSNGEITSANWSAYGCGRFVPTIDRLLIVFRIAHELFQERDGLVEKAPDIVTIMHDAWQRDPDRYNSRTFADVTGQKLAKMSRLLRQKSKPVNPQQLEKKLRAAMPELFEFEKKEKKPRREPPTPAEPVAVPISEPSTLLPEIDLRSVEGVVAASNSRHVSEYRHTKQLLAALGITLNDGQLRKFTRTALSGLIELGASAESIIAALRGGQLSDDEKPVAFKRR